MDCDALSLPGWNFVSDTGGPAVVPLSRKREKHMEFDFGAEAGGPAAVPQREKHTEIWLWPPKPVAPPLSRCLASWWEKKQLEQKQLQQKQLEQKQLEPGLLEKMS